MAIRSDDYHDDEDDFTTDDTGDWPRSVAGLLLTAFVCIVICLATAYLLRITVEAIH